MKRINIIMAGEQSLRFPMRFHKVCRVSWGVCQKECKNPVQLGKEFANYLFQNTSYQFYESMEREIKRLGEPNAIIDTSYLREIK